MTTGEWALLAALALIFVALIWVGTLLVRLGKRSAAEPEQSAAATAADKSHIEAAVEDINHLFNKDFREELRNRGRLRFENIIDENAMFLKQDLDMTIAQVNEYIKKAIDGKLNEEFAAYEKAMKDAQELAMSSLQKSVSAVEENRQAMAETLKTDVAKREAALITAYEENMAKIVEHYLLEALGDRFDLKSQLPYIIGQMETNKAGIMEDMQL